MPGQPVGQGRPHGGDEPSGGRAVLNRKTTKRDAASTGVGHPHCPRELRGEHPPCRSGDIATPTPVPVSPARVPCFHRWKSIRPARARGFEREQGPRSKDRPSRRSGRTGGCPIHGHTAKASRHSCRRTVADLGSPERVTVRARRGRSGAGAAEPPVREYPEGDS